MNWTTGLVSPGGRALCFLLLDAMHGRGHDWFRFTQCMF
jgi:hypothetical protein